MSAVCCTDYSTVCTVTSAVGTSQCTVEQVFVRYCILLKTAETYSCSALTMLSVLSKMMFIYFTVWPATLVDPCIPTGLSIPHSKIAIHTDTVRLFHIFTSSLACSPYICLSAVIAKPQSSTACRSLTDTLLFRALDAAVVDGCTCVIALAHRDSYLKLT